MKNDNIPNWDEYFIKFARIASSRSRDNSSKVGAVIVKENRIISTGYNDFPSGVDDSKIERRERPLKYLWTVHAEENAIMAAAKHGISCKDASIYISPFFPCERCARGIIQAGINIVNIDNSQENIRYKGDISMEMFNEAGIKVNIFS